MSRKEPLKPAYVIWGEDRAKVEEAIQRLVMRVAAEGGMPPERMRAAETPADAVVAACEALSFGGMRLVVVDGADEWKAADAPALVAYLGAPNEGTCLALVARDAVTPKLEAAVKALGERTLLRFGPDAKLKKGDRERWLVDRVRAEVERAGGSMPPAVARAVVERVSVDRPGVRREGTVVLELAQEARKLAAYAAGEPITKDMVRLLVARHPDARVYELADAVMTGDAVAAYDLLQDMATGDEPVEPVVINAQLAGHTRRVAAVQALGPRPTEAAVGTATGVKGFPARKLIEHARAVPAGAAESMIARVAALEIDLRISAVRDLGAPRAEGARADGARLVIELAVRDLLAMARGGKPAPGHGA